MTEIPPAVRAVLAGQRSLAIALEAVALDLEAAGIPAVFTRGQAATIRAFSDDIEQTEQTRIDAGSES